jgi:hypothetical protein
MLIRNIPWYDWYYATSTWDVISPNWNILSKNDNGRWYLTVSVKCNGKYMNKRLHRLIIIAFKDKIDWKNEVNHIDWNKYNNDISNLERSNRSENMKHW